ncbi:MAG: SusC/RagA family TonB-linked outer membrane protein [Balneolales bacterium]|nr:SusC/RagA family TonB-linked outer membrane protein [Balneolales bacterium]
MNNNELLLSEFPEKGEEGISARRRDAFGWLKRFRIALFAVVLIAGINLGQANAQERVEITGVVTDADDGSPLIGVNVVVQGSLEATGTTIGAATNINGEYAIRVPSNLNQLSFSSVGYQTLIVDIDGRTTIDVQLVPDTRLLDNVVVVGYGTQRESEITSSVAVISRADFQSGNINESQQLLQGKVAGLTVSRPGGDPNADFNIRLRGLSTLGANQEPLVVVDGIIGADINAVDPNDIETITVLKDASAAAIYGTRGANGVILISTRSGAGVGDQALTVSYNGFVSVSQVGNKLETLSSEQYRAFPTITNEEGESVGPTDLGNNTDWFDLVTQTGVTQSHNLNIAGGTALTNYSLSGTYRDIQSIQKGSGRQQLNARLNLTHRAMDNRLRLNTTLAITDRDEQIGLGEVFRYAALFNPTAPVRNADGSFYEQDAFDIFNPVAINEQSTLESESTRMNLGFRAEYMFDDFVPGLSASIFYARQSFSQLRGEYYSKNARFRGAGRNGLAIRESFDLRNDLVEATANYDRSFGMVRFEGTAGYSWQEFRDDVFFAEGGDFVNDSFSWNNLFASRDFANGEGTVSTFRNTNRLIGFFGRANFVIDDTYFLSAAVRQEGSSRFGVDNRWGTFFAVSGGLELTNLVDIPSVDQLKLRASYGETGSDAAGNGFSVQRYGPTGGAFLVDGQFVPSIGPVSNPNPDLKWEVKRELNIGADFAMLDARLRGSLDFYTGSTDDLLLQIFVPVPPNFAPTTWVNAAEVTNTGFEAAISYDVLRSDVNWTTGITFSTNESKLERYAAGRQLISNVGAPGLNDTPIVRVEEGSNIGDIWGWKFSRIGDNGEWLFLDRDGNERTTDGMRSLGDEARQVIGNGLPDFELSWTNTVRWQNWDFNMFWRGAFGHDLVNTYDIFHRNAFFVGSRNIMASTRDIPELREAPQFSSFQVEDASFFRLENITLGYNFLLSPEAIISSLRMYATVNNVLTITNYSGIDPEVRFADRGPTDNAGRAGDPNVLAPGIDRRDQWFTQTSFVFGVSIGF